MWKERDAKEHGSKKNWKGLLLRFLKPLKPFLSCVTKSACEPEHVHTALQQHSWISEVNKYDGVTEPCPGSFCV